MKRIITILILCTTLFCGCSQTYKDIKVSSFKLESVTPSGLSSLDAVISLGLDNPILGFVVSDLNGVIKLEGSPCLDLTADSITIDGYCSKTYTIPARCTLAPEFNPFQLVTLLNSRDFSNFTADIKARISLKNGIGKNLEFKDVPLGELIEKNL